MGGAGQPVGRRLDFLLQEVSREANTIGSKGSDSPNDCFHCFIDIRGMAKLRSTHKEPPLTSADQHQQDQRYGRAWLSEAAWDL